MMRSRLACASVARELIYYLLNRTDDSGLLGFDCDSRKRMHKSAYIVAMAVAGWFGGVAFAQEAADVPTGTASGDVPAASADADAGKQADAQIADSGADAAKATVVMTDAMLDKQLREVSTSVDTLKEDTFTTKSRLLLLREEVLQRSMNGSRLQIRHKNAMGGQYEMVQIYYAIDHEQIFARHETDGSLNKIDDEILYDSLLVPGAHQLTVLYVYKGKPWGVFRYMTDYTFKVESGYDFVVDEGKAAELIVTASESGNFFTAYEERPSVSYDYKQYDLASAITSEMDAAEQGKGK